MAEARATAKTRDFKETMAARVQSDPTFAQAPLGEAITLFVNGEPRRAPLEVHAVRGGRAGA
jgi:hypothetical protein